MPTDPRADAPRPSPRDDEPARPSWVAPLVTIVVLGALAFAGLQTWRYTHPPETATTKPTPPPPTSRRILTIAGTVSRTGKDGQKVVPKDGTIVVLQPMWTSDVQQEWERRVNEKLARACKDLGGGEAPPTVTADPASVRKADQEMARRAQAAKPATPWNHQCAGEFLTLLKENSVEAGKGSIEADGTFSVRAFPPGDLPYLVHAKAADAEWLEKLPQSGHLDFNDGNLVRE